MGKNFLKLFAGFIVVTGFAYWQWWPKHTFPSLVAKILRLGLWAESDKGENDFELALKHYLEALEECKKLEMDDLTDEYTGVQLKIAEMYERLGKLDEANFIYNEISILYVSVLTASPESKQGLRVKNLNHRCHLIQKDLRLSIKLVENEQKNPSLSKAILQTHLIIAQDQLDRLIAVQNKLNDDNSNSSLITPPFIEELLTAQDLLQAIAASQGDLILAININGKMLDTMKSFKQPPFKAIRTSCNLGSLLYLNSEEWEAKEIQFRKKINLELGEDLNQLTYKLNNNNLSFTFDGDKDSLERLMKLVKDKNSLAENYLNAIHERYKYLLQSIKYVSDNEIHELSTAVEFAALATYGSGVIHLHLSDYDLAERFFREARVRARNCKYDDLMPEIERELNKVFDERKKLKDPSTNASPSQDIELDIHL
ncbi:hypothetical protein HYPBUDRAFT_117693, partial [Hyphopichia burtonii NRRL Y-1933]